MAAYPCQFMNKMREYLKGHLKEFDYPQQCQELMLDIFDAICKDDTKRATLDSLREAYKTDMNVSYFVIEEYVKKLCDGLPFSEYSVWLLVWQLLTKRLRELYEEKCIPLSVWRESINDLKVKAEECKETKGIYGTFVASWFPNFFRLKRFTFGRLQFELARFQEEEFICSDKTTLKKGDRTLAVHIPRSDVALSKENCDASYEAAARFFADEFIGEKTVFTCSSWMLYPKNSEILHERSNVRRFGEEYEIVTLTHNPEGQHPDAWRIFGIETDKTEDLPEKSFLQRAYKKYMLEGGITGRAYGVKLL